MSKLRGPDSQKGAVQDQLGSILKILHNEYEIQNRTDTCDQAVFNRVND